MERLPENVRGILTGLTEDLKSRRSVISIGLFGSWSRGEATSSSDVDLLIVDGRNLDYEYVERAEINGVFLDLNYIPEKWVLRDFPPEIDQKIYEAEILYDSNGTLERAKSTMLKIMWLPERIEIRTGDYLVKADTLLSRGLSAYGREDYQSAKLNAMLGLETIMKIPIEISKIPLSNSHYIRALEASTRNLDLGELYEEYLKITGLSEVNRKNAESIFKAFVDMWSTVINIVEANSLAVKSLHEEIVNNLNFYCKPSFLRGITLRIRSLLQEGLFIEAVHYMLRASVDMLENYAWLLASIEGTRFDYISLVRHLKSSNVFPRVVYENALEVLMVKDVSQQDAHHSLERAREIILNIRRKRKELIAQMSTQ